MVNRAGMVSSSNQKFSLHGLLGDDFQYVYGHIIHDNIPESENKDHKVLGHTSAQGHFLE